MKMKSLLRTVYAVCSPYAPESITTSLPGFRKYFLVGPPHNHFIHEAYRLRVDNLFYDDTVNTDEWQREVYQFAKTVLIQEGLKSVCDLGCGSGYKLVANFAGIRTIGIDLPATCAYLRNTYPDREWREINLGCTFTEPIDMVIAADVIEHLPDPNAFLTYIARLGPKQIVLSTPDRNLMGKRNHAGPPGNPAHVREWSFSEFRAYIGEYFQIEKHFISNVKQGTQCILCKPFPHSGLLE